jgi:hypothetical protein
MNALDIHPAIQLIAPELRGDQFPDGHFAN